MDMVSTRHKREPSTTGTGLKGNMTALVLSHGLMEANIKVNLKTMFKRVMERKNGLMELNM